MWRVSTLIANLMSISHRGFAAKAPAKVFETTMSVWQSEYNAVVEEDQVMTTQQEGGMSL